MFGLDNFWDKSPSWILKILKWSLFHLHNLKIFKTALGQFIPNHPTKQEGVGGWQDLNLLRSLGHRKWPFSKKQYIRENCQQRGRGLIVCRFEGKRWGGRGGGGRGWKKVQVVFLRGIDTPMPQCILCTGTNTKTKLATKVHQIMVWRKKLSCQQNGQVVHYTKTLQIWCKVC